MKAETREGVRLYTCSLCGKAEPWGETWRWRSADEFTNGVRRLLFICRPDCKGTSEVQLAHLARVQPLAVAARWRVS